LTVAWLRVSKLEKALGRGDFDKRSAKLTARFAGMTNGGWYVDCRFPQRTIM
jgi:hypothetical protein